MISLEDAIAMQSDPKVYGRLLSDSSPSMRRDTTGHKWTRRGYVQNKNPSRIDLIARAVRNRKP